MGKHLRYSLMYGVLEGQKAPEAHPQKVMRELGIIYEHATPQTISDEWWFWNCENIPNPLPPFLELATFEPMEMIGFGLSEEMAIKLSNNV
jgi:hypothetical protein